MFAGLIKITGLYGKLLSQKQMKTENGKYSEIQIPEDRCQSQSVATM